jgi:hypothetical protein
MAYTKLSQSYISLLYKKKKSNSPWKLDVLNYAVPVNKRGGRNESIDHLIPKIYTEEYGDYVLVKSNKEKKLIHTFTKDYYEQNIKGKAESSLFARLNYEISINSKSLPDI